MKAQNRMISIASFILMVSLATLDVFASDLLNAISTRKLNKAKELASAGADLNERSSDIGRTPIMWASIQGQKEMVAFLISMGADVNLQDSEGKTALMLASWAGNKEIAFLLVDNRAYVNLADKEGKTALMIALRETNGDIAKFLISKGANINIKDNFGNTPLLYALIEKLPDLSGLLILKGADIFVKNKDGSTPLIYAAGNGNREIVELIVSNGVDVGSKNEALMIAVWSGQKDAAGILISNGASVNFNNGYQGKTPLMAASERGEYETAELLISAGADVNAKDYDGITPLMFTVMSGKRQVAKDADDKIPSAYYTELAGRTKVAKLLLKKVANVNARDYEGRTPLMFAAMNNLKDLTELLISKGAFTNPKDTFGNTALTYAQKNKNTEIAALITSNSRPERLAKKKLPAAVADKGVQEAKKTLVLFFNYLHDEKYNDAVRLFEPLDLNLRNWLEMNEDNKANSLKFAYSSVGVPIKPKVLEVWNVDKGVYRLKLQFVTDSGTIYVQGPCCGATEEMMPSQQEFIYFVRKTPESYKVGTYPLYRP